MSHSIIAIRNAALGLLYRNLLKPILFLIDPEKTHEMFIGIGSMISAPHFGRFCTRTFLGFKKDARLEQDILGIHFDNPIGLAAGFDYEARLTGIMKSIGMGFATVGTITNLPYEGNQKPRLGRLPPRRAIMVNKGFKNLGITATLENLRTEPGRNSGKSLLPIGLSIGKTNTLEHKTQEDGIRDICSAFKESERTGLPFSYYELNISCPNLKGNIEFYEPRHLEPLLYEVFALKLSKPVFIKMPITKTDEETLAMLDVIAHSAAAGVIIGNLWKDQAGNLSGMPTQKRSNELIKLAYEKYGKPESGKSGRLIVIGCGGVFSAEDAYRKIRLGASLVQMITGMIFEGPQVISEIDRGLGDLLKRDGFSHISQAIGGL